MREIPASGDASKEVGAAEDRRAGRSLSVPSGSLQMRIWAPPPGPSPGCSWLLTAGAHLSSRPQGGRLHGRYSFQIEGTLDPWLGEIYGLCLQASQALHLP